MRGFFDVRFGDLVKRVLVKSRILIRMGALIGIGVLINKNTFKGGAYSKGGTYWKAGAKSNHYGTPKFYKFYNLITDFILYCNLDSMVRSQ